MGFLFWLLKEYEIFIVVNVLYLKVLGILRGGEKWLVYTGLWKELLDK